MDQIGIEGLQAAPGVQNIPSVTITGFHTVNQLAMQAPAENTYQVVDQVTRIRGPHTFKAGVEYRPQQYNAIQPAQFGTYNFTNFATGYSYADFLLGIPNTTSRNYVRPSRYARFYFLSGFLQDDFKATPTLTLSYGLRYDYNRPAYDKRDAVFNVDAANGRLVVPNQTVLTTYVNPLFPRTIPIVTAAEAGFPERSLRRGDRNNFQPRFGFAWRPFGGTGTALRGGYGFFSDDFTADIFLPLYGGRVLGHREFCKYDNQQYTAVDFPTSVPGKGKHRQRRRHRTRRRLTQRLRPTVAHDGGARVGNDRSPAFLYRH